MGYWVQTPSKSACPQHTAGSVQRAPCGSGLAATRRGAWKNGGFQIDFGELSRVAEWGANHEPRKGSVAKGIHCVISATPRTAKGWRREQGRGSRDWLHRRDRGPEHRSSWPGQRNRRAYPLAGKGRFELSYTPDRVIPKQFQHPSSERKHHVSPHPIYVCRVVCRSGLPAGVEGE